MAMFRHLLLSCLNQIWRMIVESDGGSPHKRRWLPAVINVGLTESGQRQGAGESVTITEQTVLRHLWSWKSRVPSHTFFTLKPHVWRSLFAECLQKLKLESWAFRPYSPRQGGATHLFVKCGSSDRVLSAGRWNALKTAHIFLNSGLSMLSELQIPRNLFLPFHNIFSSWIKSKPPLEPAPLKGGRTGGRGKKSLQNHFFYFSDCLCLVTESSSVWRRPRWTLGGESISPGVAETRC